MIGKINQMNTAHLIIVRNNLISNLTLYIAWVIRPQKRNLPSGNLHQGMSIVFHPEGQNCEAIIVPINKELATT